MPLFSSNKINFPDSYINHSVFEEIQNVRGFYNRLAMGCFQFMPIGTSSVLNYASYFYSAIDGTLESISLLLKNGRINDAYCLVRKLYDDILLEIYIDVTRKDKYDWEKCVVVEDVENWIKGKLRVPTLKKLLGILKKSDSTKELYPYFRWDTSLKKNREFLDDSVHGNRYSRQILNCNTINVDNREKHLQNILVLVNQAFLIHLSFIFYLNPQYLMDSTYMDYMDCGENPPSGCEKWIAPYAQEAFDRYIKPHQELALFIKSTCCLEIKG